MLYLVCYDITADKTRHQLSERLLDFGARVQESVFECCLDEPAFRQMKEHLARVPLAGEDKVRIYKVCATCASSIEISGPGAVTTDPGWYIV